MTGSSKLDEAAQDVYVERFGERFVAVQETLAIAPRRLRRGHARDQQDVDLFRAGDRRFKQYARSEHDRLLDCLAQTNPIPALLHGSLR